MSVSVSYTLRNTLQNFVQSEKTVAEIFNFWNKFHLF